MNAGSGETLRLSARVQGRRASLGHACILATLAIGIMTLAGVRAADAATVTGVVVDRAGKPIEYANVSAAALKQGTITETDGTFSLDLPPGRTTLVVTQIGYQRARLEVEIVDGMAPLRVTLADEPVPVAEVVVATSSFGKSGKSEGAVLRRLDIVTTPGGAADVFQSLRALPGISAPSDGAALYVRGGDPHETLIRLDGAEIGHPYHYEGAAGGLFSAFDAYMLKSAFFSSGGFASKYGGVLSGVLDIETQDPMGLKTVSVGANMVGGGVSSSWALIPDKLSLVGTVRMSAVDLIQRIYGSPRDYVSIPSSRDGAGRLLYRYSPTGRATLLYLGSADQVGVITNLLNFEGEYRQHSSNHFAAIQFSDVLAGRIAIKGHAAGQLYRSRWTYGPTALDQHERNAEGGVDLVWPISERHELSWGGGLRRPDSEIRGTAPADSTDYQAGAPTRIFDTRARVNAPGFYLEDKLRLWGPLYATLGGRMDYASTPGIWTTDPRGALAWRVDDHQTVRVAGGRYHQLADPLYLDPVYGNLRLAPLSADHAIAGYEWKSDYGNIRVEGFRKTYHGLITNDARTFYANGGHGYARGVDIFVQGTYHWLSGWVSYGYLDSKRKEKDDPRLLPASFGVRHTVTVVAEYSLSSAWQLGARYGFTSGRPYTPVVGRTYDAARALWRPIYGENNSALLPDYHRLDLRLTHLFSLPARMGLPGSSVCALYVEGMNVLGIRNVMNYFYSPDYTERHSTDSYFSRRLAVAGFSLSW